MKLYSYVITRDYGFAPNPFGKFCTLATCKPRIRRLAQINDWILGIGPAKYKQSHHVVFLMKVTDKITFNEYWSDQRFQHKKPLLNGSLKQMYGDNIYEFIEENDTWKQHNSHHSNSDGTENEKNKKRDLSSNNVLISDHFYYLGNDPIELKKEFLDLSLKRRGENISENEDLISSLILWMESNFQIGYHSDPRLFTKFERYEG